MPQVIYTVVFSMFGIVLWSDPKKHKAIVWCDDCAKLAYASASDIMLGENETLAVGDLVQFTLISFGDFRGCTNLRLLESQNAPNISKHLLQTVPPQLRVVNG
jgi:hypothetical protein